MITKESLEFECEWTPVLHNDGAPYRFPSALAQGKSGPYAGPAVYWWLPFVNTPGDTQRVYIGEAANLARRVYHYLNPGPKQQTNIRIRALMDAVLRHGMQVQLDALRIERFTINGEQVPPDAFADRELRRLVENWMVLVHRREGFEVLNA